MSTLKVYAWGKPGVTNFGDEMGPDILTRLGHTVERVPLNQAEVVTIGSVLHHVQTIQHPVIVAGAGVMHNDRSINPYNMDIRLLRGKLSKDCIDWDKYRKTDYQGRRVVPFTQYGDPAMVAPLLYTKAPYIKHALGWVPHYVDKRTMPYANTTIDVLQSPQEVVRQITSCASILTSSLHALIIAQAYGIPVQRLPWHGVIGGDTKWIDYASGWAHNVEYAKGNVEDMTKHIYMILEDL